VVGCGEKLLTYFYDICEKEKIIGFEWYLINNGISLSFFSFSSASFSYIALHLLAFSLAQWNSLAFFFSTPTRFLSIQRVLHMKEENN
jgi:hypothetical protein